MSFELHNLKPGKGANRKRKRVGRGPGSGRGVTATRGHKGQKSRSGYSRRAGFEGGQMPLYRRLPKRGFTNIFAKKWAVVNVGVLERVEAGTEVTAELLKEMGIISKLQGGLRVLGHGDLTRKLTVRAHHFSGSARAKIEKAGGQAVVIGAPEAEAPVQVKGKPKAKAPQAEAKPAKAEPPEAKPKKKAAKAPEKSEKTTPAAKAKAAPKPKEEAKKASDDDRAEPAGEGPPDAKPKAKPKPKPKAKPRAASKKSADPEAPSKKAAKAPEAEKPEGDS